MGIKQELIEAAGIKKADDMDQDKLKKEIVKKVSELTDPEWDALSSPAQDWFNAAADAINEGKDAPAFPDEAVSTTRRRAAAAEKDPDPDPTTTEKWAPGMTVKVTTKRGKEYTGDIVEWDEQGCVLSSGGEELEFAAANIDSVVEVAAQGKGGKEEPASQQSLDLKPAVGDNVTITTKRGKTISGVVSEIDDEADILVINDGTDEVEIANSSIAEIKIAQKEPKASTRRPAAQPAGKTPEKAETKPEAQKRQAGAIPATQLMRIAIIDNMSASKKEIADILTKDKVQFREATLDLVFADTQKVLEILKERKLLK